MLTCDIRLRCEGGGQEDGCSAASSGITVPLLLFSPSILLELAGSWIIRPFIFTCPLSCTPPLVSPGVARLSSGNPIMCYHGRVCRAGGVC